ncbi:hypothetical protein GCM10017562_36820 [Streptomyces roseofulvus]|uniref:Imm50 family immunity protein n=1 Tax=Streptomyces roseofulvus TaxID=33902 RepID=UPI0031FD0F79
MTWISLLADSAGLESIYGGHVPDLEDVSLHEVEILREGPALNLRFDMPSFPKQPPKKWSVQGFNTVQVTLGLSGLRSVSLSGFTSNPVVSISLRAQDGITLGIESVPVQLLATAEMAYIFRISAYTNSVD